MKMPAVRFQTKVLVPVLITLASVLAMTMWVVNERFTKQVQAQAEERLEDLAATQIRTDFSVATLWKRHWMARPRLTGWRKTAFTPSYAITKCPALAASEFSNCCNGAIRTRETALSNRRVNR